eukprot:gene7254-9699_t
MADKAKASKGNPIENAIALAASGAMGIAFGIAMEKAR